MFLEVDDLCLRFVAGLVDGLWPEGRIGIILDPELNSFRALLAGDLASETSQRQRSPKRPGDDLPIAMIAFLQHLAAEPRHPVTREVRLRRARGR